jgi:hypothetical protein
VPITLLTALNFTVDGPRTISLALDQPGPPGLASIASPSTTTVTISDNDVGGTIQWSPASISVSESATSVALNAVRTGGGAGQVGVTWTITGGDAVPGVNYSGDPSGTLAFSSNSSAPDVPLAIPLLNPPGPHGSRTIEVTLSSATGGAKLGSAKLAKVTLLDDEVGFRFDKAAYPTNEGSGSQTVTVLRTGPTQTAAGVTIGTVDLPDAAAGTAVAVTDYTPATKTLTFLPNQTSQTFTISMKNDTVLDGLRTVKVELSNPTAGASLGDPNEAMLNISDNDLAGTFRFTSGTFTATEGTVTPVNITVTRTGGSGGTVDVPWSITGGTATYAAVAGPGVDVVTVVDGSLTFGPGVMSQAIQVAIQADDESSRTRP